MNALHCTPIRSSYYAKDVYSFEADPNQTDGNVEFHFILKEGCHIRLRILDVRGREVAHIHSGKLGSGLHSFLWQMAGLNLSLGFYTAVLEMQTQSGGIERKEIGILLRCRANTNT